MSFLYPLFLVAGVTLAIPVLIHLFNLRRYKTIYFPHTRFLKAIQLHSRRQREVRYKWLLFFRLLFLVSLILAFAQPFFSGEKHTDDKGRLQVLYLDNSFSMSLKSNEQRLVEKAKYAAQNQVRKAAPGTRFLLLTNDRTVSYEPMTADGVIREISKIDISASVRSPEQVFAGVRSFMQTEAMPGADIYYYSDFQRSSFTFPRDSTVAGNIRFYGVPVQAKQVANIFVDTAYLTAPVLQTGQPNQLVVRTRMEGRKPDEHPVLQLSVNGQVKSAATLGFSGNNERLDTLGFQANEPGWHQIALTVNDAAVVFDDTFRIAARSSPNLSVLVLNEGQPNPYIQAAFLSYGGFNLLQQDIGAAPASFEKYNLVILNGITGLNEEVSKSVIAALQRGQAVCIFPGRTSNTSGLNGALQRIAGISIAGMDTAAQAAASLQQGSDLVKDMFEHIPEHVQLPTASWHYIIRAALSANQQAVLSFRNGDPFLAKYTPYTGRLYLCATSADLQSGNFPGSYFFVPFLYQMAMQSGGSDIYAVTSGSGTPAYIPLNNASERNMVHITGKGIDLIPAQQTSGAGLNVFIDQSVQQPGFYHLSAAGTDTVMVALNADRKESLLACYRMDELKDRWKGGHVQWLELNDTGNVNGTAGRGSFPLWKVCAILALFMLAAETMVLAGGLRKQTVATQ